MTDRTRATFTLHICDAARDGDAPVEVRLKRLLKECLRRWAFRCVSALPGEPAPLQAPAEGVLSNEEEG